MTAEVLTTTAAGASPEETVVRLGRRITPGAFEVLHLWRETVGPSGSECQCLPACMVNIAQELTPGWPGRLQRVIRHHEYFRTGRGHPARVSREKWLEKGTDQYEGDCEHQ
jgi:hypothetical protein